MSRSLDADVITALKAEDPTPAYKSISQVFSTLPDDGLLEIEFLGRSHALEDGVYFLRDVNAVAIPKLRLTQAFLVARKVLQEYLLDSSTHPADAAMEATVVILLMDPEYLTAANVRKRILRSRLQNEPDPSSFLTREKRFVDSLLTSRLHRHTKSPTLWSHRRWLISCLKTYNVALNIHEDMTHIIMVAGERHPRNYYSWHHGRWLLRYFPADYSNDTARTALINDTKAWCFKHYTDISGWAFLDFLILELDDPGTQAVIASRVLAETLAIATSLGWENEATWVFMRNLAAQKCITGTDSVAPPRMNDKLSSADSQGTSNLRTIDALRDFVKARLERSG